MRGEGARTAGWGVKVWGWILRTEVHLRGHSRRHATSFDLHSYQTEQQRDHDMALQALKARQRTDYGFQLEYRTRWYVSASGLHAM